MSVKSKRAWVIDPVSRLVVAKNGMMFQYHLRITHGNGFVSTRDAKEVMYHAKKALHNSNLVVTTVF